MKSRILLQVIIIMLIFIIAAPLSAAQNSGAGPRLEPDPLSSLFVGAFDTSDWKSLFALASWVSGVSSVSEWEAAAESFAGAAAALSAEVSSMGEREKGEAVLKFMHRRFLKSYSAGQSRFDVMLSSGRYNCVSSALLYAVLGTAVGLDVSGVSVTDHAFCSAKAGDERIDVETTIPYGFDPGTKTEFHDGFGKVTGFSYVPPGKYRDRSPVDLKTLFSLVLYNRISEAESAGKYPEAVGLAADRWVLLGSGPGPEFEELILRMLNYGVSLSRAGREEDALSWAQRAVLAYGHHPKWDDFVEGVVNNLLIKLLRAGRTSEARSRIDSLKPVLTADAGGRLNMMVSDSELIEALNRVKDGGSEPEFLSVIAAAREAGILTEERIREVEENWLLKRIELIAGDEGWAAAYEAAVQVISDYGSSTRLENARRIYRANYMAELYNEAVTAFNSRRYEEAYVLINAAILKFPDEQRFLPLLRSTEQAMAAVE